ncbi:MAG TPA: cyanophycin synthetase [Burkholderiaceae bacterium]|nr:cyanophycin synthetase [Burkholderiaceae bacterium]
MKIVETRFLRGPNLHARKPCMLAVIDLQELDEIGSHEIEEFTDRLLAMLPTLHEHHCSPGYPGGFVERLREGTYMGHITEHVMLELQSLAGPEVRFGKTRMIRGRPRHYRIVAGYRYEGLAEQALTHAVEIVHAAARREPYDVAGMLAGLKAWTCRHGLGPSTQAIVDAATARGIPTLRLSEDESLFQLGWGARQRRVQATVTGASSFIAVEIASDKELTKQLLSAAGIPVPRGHVVSTLDDALQALQDIGAPATVKPLDGNQGKGVTTAIRTPEEMKTAFERACCHASKVIVEQHVAGRDHRVLVVNDRIVAASRRLPPMVIADGVHSVRELVDRENTDPRRGVGHEAALTRIPLDAAAAECLAAQGLAEETVLEEGRCVTLRGNANLSTGGTAQDVTDILHPDTAALCVRAARRIGLDVAGIDLVCRDIDRPLQEQEGAIIEVNAAPGIRMHEHPSEGVQRRAGAAIVDGLFPPGDDGRIPVIGVTGTNGKTTTTLAIAEVLRAHGWRTGYTTTEGVFVDGRRVMEGDCTGYWSARSLLTDPDVDAAVLETARGGILKRGLAYDRCDVSVVLNISADHLGQDGIETLDELAEVKAVVADVARKALVLNAEDERCVAMAANARAGGEVVYFAFDLHHPVVTSHLAEGGRAVVLRDGAIVLVGRDDARAVVRADRLPFTFGGRARHNIANALAAVAALVAMKVPLQTIARGLVRFACSSEANPLRMNTYQLHDVKLVVDYAHNLAAYRCLLDTCRTLGAGRLVGVVSAPGDRRDAELREIGRFCAEGFDETIFYELDEDRGRPLGDTVRVLREGASASGRPFEVVLDMREALRLGLERCRHGDVLVYACATHMSDISAAFGTIPLKEECSTYVPGLRLAWSSDPDVEASRPAVASSGNMRRAAVLPHVQRPD